MKIYAIQDAETAATKIDLNKFTADLRILSERYNVKLVSIGAMSGRLDVGGDGAMYLAIWRNESAERLYYGRD